MGLTANGVYSLIVGRMARVERRRKWAWYAMLAGAVALGAGIGFVVF